jgi:hypothetical protein
MGHWALRRSPTAFGPTLILSRKLLARGEEGRARPLLEMLDALEFAEGPFMLGILATRMGDYAQALKRMYRARDLNPNHPQTLDQIKWLELELGKAQEENKDDDPGEDAKPDGEA